MGKGWCEVGFSGLNIEPVKSPIGPEEIKEFLGKIIAQNDAVIANCKKVVDMNSVMLEYMSTAVWKVTIGAED